MCWPCGRSRTRRPARSRSRQVVIQPMDIGVGALTDAHTDDFVNSGARHWEARRVAWLRHPLGLPPPPYAPVPVSAAAVHDVLSETTRAAELPRRMPLRQVVELAAALWKVDARSFAD